MAFLVILLLLAGGWLLGGGAWDMVRHWFRHRGDTYEAVLLKDGRQARVVHARNPSLVSGQRDKRLVCDLDPASPAKSWEKARRDAKALRELAEFEMWFNKPAAPISGEDFMRSGHRLHCQCERCREDREVF